MFKYIFLLFFVSGCAGCNLQPIDPTPPPNPFDAGCKEACSNMQSMNCEGWQDDKQDGGLSCIQFCEETHEETFLDLDCVSTIKQCNIDQCDIDYQKEN